MENNNKEDAPTIIQKSNSAVEVQCDANPKTWPSSRRLLPSSWRTPRARTPLCSSPRTPRTADPDRRTRSSLPWSPGSWGTRTSPSGTSWDPGSTSPPAGHETGTERDSFSHLDGALLAIDFDLNLPKGFKDSRGIVQEAEAEAFRVVAL